MRATIRILLVAFLLLVGGGRGESQTLLQPVVDAPYFTCEADFITPTEAAAGGWVVGMKSGSRLTYCNHQALDAVSAGPTRRLLVDGEDTAAFTPTCTGTGSFGFYCSGVIPAGVLSRLFQTGRHTLQMADVGATTPIPVGSIATLIMGCPDLDTTTSPWTTTPTAVIVPVGRVMGQRNQMSSINFAITVGLLHASGYATTLVERTQPQLDAGTGTGGYWHIIAECKGKPQ